jgi:hypothetical protein
MNSTPNDGIFDRDNNAFQLFQNYIHYCSDEQVTLNNILHTQNLLSNNRYNMFNQMFRFINRDHPPINSWSNTPFTPPNMFTPRSRLPRARRNRHIFNTEPSPPLQTTFRPIHFPGHNHPRRTTINPLTEFINETLNDNNTRRRPTTIRQFFNSCSVFVYSNDLSNNQIHCPITMQNFNNGDICIRMPCNHIFKYRPLLQWLSTARTCPMCRLQIPHAPRRNTMGDTSNNPIDVDADTNNVSIQTSDISNGFIADISANSIEDLSQALSQTVTARIQNLFNNMDISGNIPMAWSTNISLVTPRDLRQSPINNLIITSDSSGNIDIDHILPNV